MADVASPELTDLALTRLLQLASPTLPVGAYSYSQGLGSAVEQGLVHDQTSAQQWIQDVLTFSSGRFEAPVWWRLYQAWSQQDLAAVQHWNDLFCASRETAEFRAENQQMGYSMQRLLVDLNIFPSARMGALHEIHSIAFVTLFTFAAVEWAIPARAALLAYLWMWTENQVMAALKSVPLGQLAGQKILSRIAASLPAIAENAMTMPDDELSNFSPYLTISSSKHETQYSRLFRS